MWVRFDSDSIPTRFRFESDSRKSGILHTFTDPLWTPISRKSVLLRTFTDPLGGTMAGLWRNYGGTMAGLWRDYGGTMAGLWRNYGGTMAIVPPSRCAHGVATDWRTTRTGHRAGVFNIRWPRCAHGLANRAMCPPRGGI